MNIKKYWMMLAIVLTGLCMVSCSGDDDDDDNESGYKENSIFANDPEGTIIANLTNTFKQGYNGYYDNGIDNMNGGWMCYLGMNSSNNLQVANRSSNIDFYSIDIVSIGKVNGLSAIKNIPETGWTKQTAAIPGYGYVCRTKYYFSNGPYSSGGQYVYARIYAIDYMTSTSSGIMGITIKYQEKWKPDTE
ncbi:MAG: hypothetical protein IJT97_04890 [Bacteroidaceae bacterium]|nr:hypothetical protein [Bacteroidaceae bacterium]